MKANSDFFERYSTASKPSNRLATGTQWGSPCLLHGHGLGYPSVPTKYLVILANFALQQSAKITLVEKILRIPTMFTLHEI